MRVVMVTDDGHPIDRRILLEGSSLRELGHDVIVIARSKDGMETNGYVCDGVKVLHIDSSLDYLGGAQTAPDLAPLAGHNQLSVDTGSASRFSLRGVITRTIERCRLRMARYYERLRDHKAHHVASHAAVQRALLNDGPGNGARFRTYRLLASGAVKALVSRALFAALDCMRVVYRYFIRHGLRDRSKVVTVDGVQLVMNAWEDLVYHRLVFFDPDIIHCHDLPQLLPSVLAARELGAKLVYDAHEIYPEISTLTAQQKLELKNKENTLVQHCDILITVNSYCAQYMEEVYHCSPFHVILNAAISPATTESKCDLRAHLALGSENKILLYQGWIADVGRGLVQLVEAMALVPDHIHLVMMGYGDSQLFRRIAKINGVDGRVHILPAVPGNELIHWSASADAGVIPYQPIDLNHLYCAPNKLFEYIAARLPILANDLPYLRDVVAGEGFGLVHPMRGKMEIAFAIRAMFDAETRVLDSARASLCARGAAWEWGRQAEILKGIYPIK